MCWEGGTSSLSNYHEAVFPRADSVSIYGAWLVSQGARAFTGSHICCAQTYADMINIQMHFSDALIYMGPRG